MNPSTLLRRFAALTVAGLSFAVHSAEGSAGVSSRPPAKKMQMAAPMAGGMAKRGMMKGDVKSAADKKHQAMQPMMEQEQKAMPPAAGKE